MRRSWHRLTYEFRPDDRFPPALTTMSNHFAGGYQGMDDSTTFQPMSQASVAEMKERIDELSRRVKRLEAKEGNRVNTAWGVMTREEARSTTIVFIIAILGIGLFVGFAVMVNMDIINL